MHSWLAQTRNTWSTTLAEDIRHCKAENVMVLNKVGGVEIAQSLTIIREPSDPLNYLESKNFCLPVSLTEPNIHGLSSNSCRSITHHRQF